MCLPEISDSVGNLLATTTLFVPSFRGHSYDSVNRQSLEDILRLYKFLLVNIIRDYLLNQLGIPLWITEVVRSRLI